MAVVRVWDSHSYTLALIPAPPLLLLALLFVLGQKPEQMIRFVILNRGSNAACFASSVPVCIWRKMIPRKFSESFFEA